jgi:uncharacterized Zn finger protein
MVIECSKCGNSENIKNVLWKENREGKISEVMVLCSKHGIVKASSSWIYEDIYELKQKGEVIE